MYVVIGCTAWVVCCVGAFRETPLRQGISCNRRSVLDPWVGLFECC